MSFYSLMHGQGRVICNRESVSQIEKGKRVYYVGQNPILDTLLRLGLQGGILLTTRCLIFHRPAEPTQSFFFFLAIIWGLKLLQGDSIFPSLLCPALLTTAIAHCLIQSVFVSNSIPSGLLRNVNLGLKCYIFAKIRSESILSV